EIDAAFATFVRERPEAAFVGLDVFFIGRRVQLVNLASRHAPPATANYRIARGSSVSRKRRSPNGRYGTYVARCQRHSGLMFAARMTLAHFAVSSATNFAKSTGELASGVPPNSTSRVLMLGSTSATLISAF